jgi:hypothetical protein
MIMRVAEARTASAMFRRMGVTLAEGFVADDLLVMHLAPGSLVDLGLRTVLQARPESKIGEPALRVEVPRMPGSDQRWSILQLWCQDHPGMFRFGYHHNCKIDG